MIEANGMRKEKEGVPGNTFTYVYMHLRKQPYEAQDP